ncbi:MAG: carboxymuconolactone decarboxylase family protein [Blastocatellia bacterium]|nr:carboxymuconolactone decarboxylase family protein [Blastocatellia bacterium]
MKLFAATVMLFSLLASAPSKTNGQTNQAGATARNGAVSQVSKTISITRNSAPPPQMREAENFTGLVGVEFLQEATAPSHLAAGRVTFAPGARTAWHSHPLGQTLIVTTGAGWVQQEGGEKQEIKVGDVVWTPPGVKHWHGATATDRMTHIALTEQQSDGKRVDWMEKVSDAQYSAPIQAQAATLLLGSAAPNAVSNQQPRPSQRAIGDFSPKLAQLTDDVLYADVWERPQLGKRDRSLVTVAALIAMNRPDQLRSHFARARDNGVTQEELIETITHMAFYAGWPSAITAIGIAKEVFEKK